MAAPQSSGNLSPTPGPRRSFTLPTRLSTAADRDAVNRAKEPSPQIETLFAHNEARIINFKTSANASISLKERARTQSLEAGSKEATGTLPWRTNAESLLATGPLSIYRVPGSVAFLSAGTFLKPVLAKSQCWCVDGETIFVLKRGLHDFYRIELPNRDDDDRCVAADFVTALKEILRYEQTPCPFRRGFHVELPDTPDVTYIPWKPKHRPISPIRDTNETLFERPSPQSARTAPINITFQERPLTSSSRASSTKGSGIDPVDTQGSPGQTNDDSQRRSIRPTIGRYEVLIQSHAEDHARAQENESPHGNGMVSEAQPNTEISKWGTGTISPVSSPPTSLTPSKLNFDLSSTVSSPDLKGGETVQSRGDENMEDDLRSLQPNIESVNALTLDIEQTPGGSLPGTASLSQTAPDRPIWYTQDPENNNLSRNGSEYELEEREDHPKSPYHSSTDNSIPDKKQVLHDEVETLNNFEVGDISLGQLETSLKASEFKRTPEECSQEPLESLKETYAVESLVPEEHIESEGDTVHTPRTKIDKDVASPTMSDMSTSPSWSEPHIMPESSKDQLALSTGIENLNFQDTNAFSLASGNHELDAINTTLHAEHCASDDRDHTIRDVSPVEISTETPDLLNGTVVSLPSPVSNDALDLSPSISTLRCNTGDNLTVSPSTDDPKSLVEDTSVTNHSQLDIDHAEPEETKHSNANAMDEPKTPHWHSFEDSPISLSPSSKHPDEIQKPKEAEVGQISQESQAVPLLSVKSSPHMQPELSHAADAAPSYTGTNSDGIQTLHHSLSKSSLQSQSKMSISQESYERVGAAIGQKMASILLGPPLHLATIMLRIALNFTNGVRIKDEKGEGWRRRGEAGRTLPGAWEIHSEDDGQSDAESDYDYGLDMYGIEISDDSP